MTTKRGSAAERALSEHLKEKGYIAGDKFKTQPRFSWYDMAEFAEVYASAQPRWIACKELRIWGRPTSMLA